MLHSPLPILPVGVPNWDLGFPRPNTDVQFGIFDGDLLIIDKSIEPSNDKIAICQIDGDFTVKRIKIEYDTIWLIAENEAYEPIKVTADNELMIWGIVVASIKKF